jgi:hypothetical protein
MKEVHKIILKEGSALWKAKKNVPIEEAAEKAALDAADKARKEVLANAAKREAADKAYRDSIKEYDRLVFQSDPERKQIQESIARRKYLEKQVSDEYATQKSIDKEIKDCCPHEMVVERRTSWRDEYDSWHEGPYERKCIECFLVEEQKYYADTNKKCYSKLEKSQRVLLRRIVDGKEYELEFDDLKW